MDLKWLEDVLVLLEEGNMTRAADRRNITQPAFSRRIRAFEDWLGSDVLDRKSNRVDISPALASNEAEIRALRARLEELRIKISRYAPQTTVVTIAAQHAPVISSFPEMALKARSTFPGLRFHMRAGDLDECMTQFLRGDASILLCHEAQNSEPLQFGAGIQRALCGQDCLIPVVGGDLRPQADDISEETPAIVYPETSYFGAVLTKGERCFGTARFSINPVGQTEFSNGVYELALKGLGVGWVPLSMAKDALGSGDLISLAKTFGTEPLNIAVYAQTKVEMAAHLVALWGEHEAA